MGNAARWMLAVGTILLVLPSLGVRAADKEEMVENPYYKYWANHKEGSTVTLHEKTVFSGPEKEQYPDGADEKVVASKLLKVGRGDVVVQVTVTESDFLNTIESAPTKKAYPFMVTKANLQAGLHGVDPKIGKETLTVLGEKLECTTLSGTEKKGGTEVEHKVWVSDKVPGGIVKHTRTLKQDGKVVADTTIIVTAYKSGE
jgi:hypothetical protein